MKKTSKNPKKAPIQQRSRHTRDAILKGAAHILLSKDGLAGLNSNAIAKRAGVSIGSFYQYYTNKESVLLELIEGRMANLVQVMNERLVENAHQVSIHPREALFQLMMVMMNEFKKDQLLALLMFQYSHVIADQARMEHVEKDMVPMIAAIIEKSIPKLRKKDLHLAVYMMLQSYRGIVAVSSARRFKEYSVEELAAETTDLFWRYLSSVEE